MHAHDRRMLEVRQAVVRPNNEGATNRCVTICDKGCDDKCELGETTKARSVAYTHM